MQRRSQRGIVNFPVRHAMELEAGRRFYSLSTTLALFAPSRFFWTTQEWRVLGAAVPSHFNRTR